MFRTEDIIDEITQWIDSNVSVQPEPSGQNLTN